MKNLYFLFFASFLILKLNAQDTVVVQTLTWDNPARSGMFTFPNDPPETWEKILMLYNMRCHDAAVGNGFVGCYEWDYSCNTFITDNSRRDSTRATAPSHVISNFNNTPGAIFPYRSQPTYTYYRFNQHNVSYQNTTSENSYKVGADDLDLPLGNGSKVAKMQFLYRASELTAAGLTTGKISGLKADVSAFGSALDFLRIRIKATSKTELDPTNPDTDGFTEVYFLNTKFDAAGEYFFRFYNNFDWNGSTSLIVEFSFTSTGAVSGNELAGHDAGYPAALVSDESDNSLLFEGSGAVNISGDKLSTVTDEITVAFWSYGTPDKLPVNTSVFEARDIENRRQLNVHLPWDNGRIYWDAGNDGGGYDRIEKDAIASEYEGKWNHWAFTKNTATGSMKIFLNGRLWHSGTGKTKRINISDFGFGAGLNASNPYFGKVDEFQIWNKELDDNTIKAWLRKPVDASHPFYANLVAYFPLDEGQGFQAGSVAGSPFDAPISGSPAWSQARGENLFKNFEALQLRPSLSFVRGNYTVQDEAITVLDSTQNSPNVVVFYTVTGTDLVATDTQLLYYADLAPVLDEDGNIVDFIEINPENSLSISQLTYFQKTPAKFEILSLVTPYGNGLDLGQAGKTFTIDVSDYAPILTGEKRMSIELGGENQEELDIKFLFIKGTPARNVINVQNIWPFRRGSFTQILTDQAFEPRQMSLDANGKMFKLRSSITGHEQNGEFEIRNHYINLGGGAKEFNYDVFKECSDIPIYPQGGTWLFDRAGWCPGDPTIVHQFDITNMVSPGGSVEIDYGVNGASMDQANYLVSNQLVTYGAPNFNLDAAIVEIIRPTTQLEHARFNPACNTPKVRIKNNGSTPLTSLDIEYGPAGGLKLSYRWTGNLAFLQTADVELPLDFLSFWETGTNSFEVRISNPNNGNDEYDKNNFAKSAFERPQEFTFPVQFELRTNTRPLETSYRIKDMTGAIIFERSNLQANTNYKDELMLGRGCYTLELDDSGDDGLYYWYWEQVGPARGAGYARFNRILPNGSGISIRTLQREFGRFIRFDFVIPQAVSVNDLSDLQLFSIYPNPASDFIQVELDGFGNDDFELAITDINGKVLKRQTFKSHSGRQIEKIDVENLPSGMYFIKVVHEHKVWTRQFVRS